MTRQGFSHVTTWVFDLDNTLYPPAMGLFPQIERRMTTWVMDHLGLTREMADHLRATYWKTYGTTLAGLMREHGVDPQPYLAYVHDIDFSVLSPDPALAATIRALPGRRIVYTNADVAYAARVLAARGLGGLFDAVYGVAEAGYLPKPGRFLPVSLDGDENLYLWALACLAFVDEKGMNHHLEPVHQLIRATLQKIHDEEPNLYREVQKRIPMLHLEGGDQAAGEMQLILEYAASHNLMVELTYLPPAAHRTQLRRVTPRTVDGDHLQAFCHLHQEDMAFRLTRIQGARLLSERGWTPGHEQAV